jgi:hypothetical protein
MKNSVHDNGGFIGRVANYAAVDYYTTLESNNYAVENGVYTNVSMATGFTSSTNVVFSTDGTKVYFHESGTRNGNYATLSTPSDLSTASSLTSYSVRNNISVQGLTFNPTGTMLYYVGSSGNIYISALSTAWDISTRGSETILSLGIPSPIDFQFNNDGTKAYTMRSGNIYLWPLSTAYDFTTKGSIVSKSLGISGQEGFRFNNDGTKLFALHGQASPGARIVEYSLSTAYDITSAGAGTTHSDISTQLSDPRGFTFSHDGTNFYVVGENNANVYEYSFTSTVTFNQNKKNTAVWSMGAHYLNREATPQGGYRYIKWHITDIKSMSASMTQISELYLKYNGSNISWGSATITNPGGNNPSSEQPSKLIDGDEYSKVLDNNIDQGGGSIFIIDAGVGNLFGFDSYYYVTGNDTSARDPISWTIEGSNNGTNYTVLHTVTNATITDSRIADTQTFTL